MTYALILIGIGILLPALLYFEKREHAAGKLFTKTPLSALFIVAAIAQQHPEPFYYYFLLAGLIFCLLGDIFLVYSNRKLFMAGLVSFLLGHIAYVCGFLVLAKLSIFAALAAAGLIVIGGIIFRWLKPHLGSMAPAVGLYIAIITAMVAGAVSVYANKSLPDHGRVMVLAGSGFFYISDIFVARNRFVKNEFVNRLWGLPLYYTGQFLIAFSIGHIG